jgi:hypothetical protein
MLRNTTVGKTYSKMLDDTFFREFKPEALEISIKSCKWIGEVNDMLQEFKDSKVYTRVPTDIAAQPKLFFAMLKMLISASVKDLPSADVYVELTAYGPMIPAADSGQRPTNMSILMASLAYKLNTNDATNLRYTPTLLDFTTSEMVECLEGFCKQKQLVENM